MAKQAAIILDDDDPLPNPRRNREWLPRSRDGYEWGLASSMIGAVFLVIGPLTMLVLMVVGRDASSDSSARTSDSAKLEIAALFGIVVAEALCIAGFFFGMHGLSRARAERSPMALPIAGILLNLAATLLWLVVSFVAVVRS